MHTETHPPTRAQRIAALLPPLEERRARDAARQAAAYYVPLALRALKRAQYAARRAERAAIYDSRARRHYRESTQSAAHDLAQYKHAAHVAARAAYLANGGRVADAERRAAKAAARALDPIMERAAQAQKRAHDAETEAYTRCSLERVTFAIDRIGDLKIYIGEVNPRTARPNDGILISLSQDIAHAYENSDLTPSERAELDKGYSIVAGINADLLLALQGIDY